MNIPTITDHTHCALCTRLREWVTATFLAVLLFMAMWAVFLDTNNARSIQNELRNDDGVRAEVFAPGERIWGYRMFCVDKVVPGTSIVEAVNVDNGATYALGSRATGATVGCNPRKLSARLPTDIPEGVYEYRSTVTYHVNPLRTIVVPLPPMRFTVQQKPKEIRK